MTRNHHDIPKDPTQRAGWEMDTRRAIYDGTLNHADMFDDTGHLTEEGKIAAGIARWDNDATATQQEVHAELSINRVEDLDEAREAAEAEEFYRYWETAGRVALGVIDGARASSAEDIKRSTNAGDSRKANPFANPHPRKGTVGDRTLAAKLPRYVSRELSERPAPRKGAPVAELFAMAAQEVTQDALIDVMADEPSGVVRGALDTLFGDRTSRTDRTIQRLEQNTREAGRHAQQLGDEKLAEIRKSKDTGSPFRQS